MSKKKSRAARARKLAAVPGSAPAPRGPSPWEGLSASLKIIEPASVALLFVVLLSVTWMRWSEPLVDFPRSLYTAWRMTQGALPYVDVQSWYGPLSHLAEAAAFKIFGVGLDTMVWLNIAVTIGVLLLLRGILGALGSRLLVWVGSVVFLVVFAFAHTIIVGNYNFITPYASQATYGFLGCLLAIWALVRNIEKPHNIWLGLAGAGVGVAYVSKPEPLLAAGGAAAFYLVADTVRQFRAPLPEGGAARALSGFARNAGWLAAGFFSVWLAVFLVMAVLGGPGYALMGANWVVHTLFSNSFRETGVSSDFNAGLFGFDEPGKNFVNHLLAGGLFALIAALVLLAGWIWSRAPRGSPKRWAAIALAVAVAVGTGLRAPWQKSGMSMIFPTVLAAGYFIWMTLRAAWRGRDDYSRLLGLAVFGVAAALMLARMPLNGRLYHYGFFMMPLAVEFLLLLLLVVLPRALAGDDRAACLAPCAFTVIALCATVAQWQMSSSYYVMKTLAVGEGRDRFYTFEGSASVSGYLLKSIMEQVRAEEPGARTLIALPESAALNYHLRLANPIAETEFQPTTLAFVGRDRVLRDLTGHPPDIVVIYSRNLDEYGVRYFGETPAAGADILQWVQQNYDSDFALVLPEGKSLYSFSGDIFDIYRRKGWARNDPPQR